MLRLMHSYSLLPIIPHIAGYMRDERHVEGLWLPKRRGLYSSHSQPEPKLRRPRHRCAHTAHWKYMMESQTKYASYRDIQRSLRNLPTGMVVASALWRRSFWKHNQAYRRLIWRMQRCVNWFGSSYHCMHCSWSDRHFMEERNKIHSFNTCEGIGGRKSGGRKRPKTRCRYLHWFYFSSF